MIKIYRTKKCLPTVTHESDARNRKLVSENFWNLQACAKVTSSRHIRTANHIAHIIFVLHSAMNTRLLTNQNVWTIQTIL